MFDQLIESSTHRERRSRSLVVLSLMIHSILLGGLIVVPLVYYQILPELPARPERVVLTEVLPPEPPKPEPVVAKPQVKEITLDPKIFFPPTEIPTTIPVALDEIPEVTSLTGIIDKNLGAVSGGIPGVIPGGRTGGVIGSLKTEAPLPVLPTKKTPIRIGGDVQASRLVHRVEPDYPELAKRARVSGLVILQVVVSEEGLVEDVKIIRGHPLLNEAAVRAVRQWRYSPYLLNGDPIPVTATVTVNFVLR